MFVPCTLCKKIMPFEERRIRNQHDYHRKCIWHVGTLGTIRKFLLKWYARNVKLIAIRYLMKMYVIGYVLTVSFITLSKITGHFG